MKKQQNDVRTYDLVFVLEGWIRRVADTGKVCHLCRDPARFTCKNYGYQGVEEDLKYLDDLEEEDPDAFEKIGKQAAQVLDKLYRAQCHGSYRVIGTLYLCGRCLAEMAETHVALEHVGALTVTELVTSAGKTSCLKGWQVFSKDGKRCVPVLVYTQARTMDQVLQFVRKPARLLDEREARS
jgi:hypothetical protein